MGWKMNLFVVVLFAVAINGIENARQNRPNTYSETATDTEEEEDEGGPDGPEGEPEVEPPIIVNITQGSVRGYVRDNNVPVLSFIDIPYGKYEKFGAPSEAASWPGVHDVKEHTKRCPQLDNNNIHGDEDCLVLSVFKPLNTNAVSVLFHIHDGNFLHGSGDFNIYGPEYFAQKGIIVVLPNYRLGVLGFLCLQNKTAPGNAALKDLTLALEWVKMNIGFFGGDPDRITVSAEGQAGALVGLLALSPKSNYLFNRAITESGAILSPWALDRNATAKALKLIQLLSEGSKEENDSVLTETELEAILLTAKNNDLIFKPCVEKGENSFITNTPWKIMNEKGFHTNITFMIGSANKAGIHETEGHTDESIAKLNDNPKLLIPNDLVFANKPNAQRAAANAIRRLYFNESKISNNTKEELALFYTDSSYLGPSLRVARYLLNGGALVYLYEFACDGPRNVEKLAINSNIPGAARGDIIGYVFKQKELAAEEDETSDEQVPEKDENETLAKVGANESDEIVVKLLLDFWASFIIDGEPTSTQMTWSSINSTKEKLMIFSANPTLEDAVHTHRMELWTDLYKQHFIERNNANVADVSMVALFCILLCRQLNFID